MFDSKAIIAAALKEDMGRGDITSRIFISKEKKVKAVILLKQDAVIAGIELAEEVFKTADKSLKFKARCLDGSRQKKGRIIAVIEGSARSILGAERAALNFLSHLSGVASLSWEYARRIHPYKAGILDTRKTIPGLRGLEKWAVALGGGYNHRKGLWDGILIKDNHLKIMGERFWVDGLKKARRTVGPEMKIEIEVKTLAEFKKALKIKPDIIMLDNMNIARIRQALRIRGAAGLTQRVKLEVSGGVNLDNVREIAKTGVDTISIGALTHSSKAIDLSLEIIKK